MLPALARATRAPLALVLTLSPLAAAADLHVDAGLASGANDGSTWADAFQGPDGLQAALAAATAGDRVFVRQGTYVPTTTATRTISFTLPAGVEVYGGFAGGESDPAQRPPIGSAPTVLSGDLGTLGVVTDNSFHVVNAAGATAASVLDGFTLRDGNANGSGNNNKGGGILCLSGASPTVRNCRFEANRCTFGGGAGYVNSSAPSFTDCQFVDNVGGSFGGAFDVATAGAVRWERCTFTGNTAARAGALEIFSSTGPVVSNCLFEANVATGSGGGGGLWIGSGGNAQVRGCTVVKNRSTAQVAGGIMVSGAASASVANTILWDNEGPGGAQGSTNQLSGSTNVTYCVVEGGLAGTGNLGLDPQFFAPTTGDYRLAFGSPAIDAGNNGAVPAGTTLDLGGNPRFVDDGAAPDTGAGTAPIVDIGAYEADGVQVLAAYCFGDGSGTPCPCTNPGTTGRGCANGTYTSGAKLSASGVPSVSNDTLVLSVTASTPGQPGIFFLGDNAVNGGAGVTFGDGLRCAGGGVCRVQVRTADLFGDLASSISVSAKCGLVQGDVKRLQWWYRDPSASPCGTGFNLSNGLEVTWLP
ncbi:MAG: right-handed parallel beta-helix repeat-containing protein [Planctomycetes bacterium]|nr:right-handed parallel beta-helix repeat-containing protein [Planctomycetota bacterium]